MTIEEQVRELERLRGAARGRGADEAWQPRVIAEAFGTQAPGTLPAITMQGWIDLDRVRSPFIAGTELTDADREIAEALRALRPERLEAWLGLIEDARAAVEVELEIRAIMAEAFSTALEMEPEEGGMTRAADGMGWWIVVYAALVSRMPSQEALALPVKQANAILAGWRRNEGWMVKGVRYCDRVTVNLAEAL